MNEPRWKKEERERVLKYRLKEGYEQSKTGGRRRWFYCEDCGCDMFTAVSMIRCRLCDRQVCIENCANYETEECYDKEDCVSDCSESY